VRTRIGRTSSRWPATTATSRTTSAPSTCQACRQTGWTSFAVPPCSSP
jgi:hypothetical protein